MTKVQSEFIQLCNSNMLPNLPQLKMKMNIKKLTTHVRTVCEVEIIKVESFIMN